MRSKFLTRNWFAALLERIKTRFSVRVALTITLTLTYGSGLWLNLFHDADGATELNEPPPAIHWLRDSTLMLPLVLVSVFAALFFARWFLHRFSQNTQRILEGAVVVASIALLTSVTLALASPIHNNLFQAHHLVHLHSGDAAAPLALQPSNVETSLDLQASDVETPPTFQQVDVEPPVAFHMLFDGTLALIGNLVLSTILYALLRRRLWGKRPAHRVRIVKLGVPAQLMR